MDLNRVSTKESAEEGEPLHLLHPVLGHEIYTGEGADADGRLIDRDKPHEPVELIVRGFHSASVQEVVKRQQKKALRSESAQEKAGADLIDAVIVSWTNVVRGDETLPCTRANKVWLMELDPDFWAQVQRFGQDREVFFKPGSKS